MSVDLTFFKKSKHEYLLSEIFSIAGIASEDNNHVDMNDVVQNCSSLLDATEMDISFVNKSIYVADVSRSKARYVLASSEIFCNVAEDIQKRLIVCSDPYFAIAKITNHFYPEVNRPSVETCKDLSVYKNVEFGNNVSIGNNVEIGENSIIMHNVSIADNVKIGKNSIIYNNCTIKYATIGDNCIIHPGVNIGQDGFGFAVCPKTKGIEKITHLGLVRIGNNVEIGAGTCIDRGSFSDTVIGNYVKLDNLIQIGHNVEIGDYTVASGCSAFAGSTKVGMGCLIGGQVGFKGHIKIGNRVTIAAKSGVTKDIKDGQTIGGYPAVDVKTWKKNIATFNRLSKK